MELDVRDFGAVADGRVFSPEPIWPLHMTAEQIERGEWVRIEPSDIVDYEVNPFAAGWEFRYTYRAVEQLKAAGLPRLEP